MSSNSEIRRSIRRLKRDVKEKSLQARTLQQLPSIDLWIERGDRLPRLLLDTTVYIDQLQGKLPRNVESALKATSLWHSTVTECELCALAGLLDPRHPDSAKAVDEVIGSVERRPEHRIVNPDRESWREAGVVAGMLTRLQKYGKAERRRALNDALIFLSAAKAGLVVLTRNVSDYDLLLQLVPRGNALFYQIV